MTNRARGDRGQLGRDLNIYLGSRVRARRRQSGWSMEALAASLGITYQQVQKYEKGLNRISASTLFEIANALNVPVAEFYDDLPGASAGTGPEMLHAFLSLSRQLQRPLVDLACNLTNEGARETPARIVALPTWRR